MTTAFKRVVHCVKKTVARLFTEPACLFDEQNYQHVFGSSDDECIRSFDCNAGDHSDACPLSKRS